MENIFLVTSQPCAARIEFGVQKLGKILSASGYSVCYSGTPIRSQRRFIIAAGEYSDNTILEYARKASLPVPSEPGKEGYSIISGKNIILILGADASGVLYGCLELADSVMKTGNLPLHLHKTDQPEMVLRGACIGLQKTTCLPGRKVYEYPYTPENFPWFYDKELWIRYLDMLVENRLNSLYLWNGHPFASLVRLPDYPFALEVDDSTFARNEEMFSFLTCEADKRGIWVIQMFYNILVSKPFADHYGIKTQDRNRPVSPLIADYTRKSIAAFIVKYPNVGLTVCLGEAIPTIEDDIDWFTQTIIPGIRDGMAVLGLAEEIPLILRGHDTDPQRVMAAALPLYKNLYTMQKYNGESLTTYEPRDTWKSIHQELSRLGSVHISNVHIMANLEPFRYGSPFFIQKCVQAMHDIQGANGLHLYPQASYWDWPYTADIANPRLLEMDRDRIWYQAWARYAWNCHRSPDGERDFWSLQLAGFYGCGEHGADILNTYEETGEIAPKLLRRFGISDGNRQTLLLGMFMSQLVNPYKWRVYSNFYRSNGPEGEILIDWAEKEWKGLVHTGETPPQIIDEVLAHGRRARDAIDAAEPFVGKNKAEFIRLKNDVYCYDAIARFFAHKVNAAMFVLRYRYSKDIADLEKALPCLQKSLLCYAELTALTRDSYLYANSMQTGQRRIPVEGTDGRYKTWEEILPLYTNELKNFTSNLTKLKSADPAVPESKPLFIPAEVMLHEGTYTFFSPEKGETVYSDMPYKIREAAPELQNLKGLKLNFKEQLDKGTSVHFSSRVPVKIVVGFFSGHSNQLLDPPTLETDAGANNRGQAEIRIANALSVEGLFPVHLYTYRFDPGEHILDLGKGLVLILGFINGNYEFETFDAGIGTEGTKTDWLFY